MGRHFGRTRTGQKPSVEMGREEGRPAGCRQRRWEIRLEAGRVRQAGTQKALGQGLGSSQGMTGSLGVFCSTGTD